MCRVIQISYELSTLIFQQLLNEHPFHIDAILQLSDICKMGEDSARAAELIERTLYAMEAQSLITLWEEKFCKQNFLHTQYSYSRSQMLTI